MLCNTLQVALNKTLHSSLPQVEIEATELRSGIAYAARVRCKVSENENSYHSQWSEWSQTTVFQRAGTKNLTSFLFMSMLQKRRHMVKLSFSNKNLLSSIIHSQITSLKAFSCLFHLQRLVIWGSILTSRLFIKKFCADSFSRCPKSL